MAVEDSQVKGGWSKEVCSVSMFQPSNIELFIATNWWFGALRVTSIRFNPRSYTCLLAWPIKQPLLCMWSNYSTTRVVIQQYVRLTLFEAYFHNYYNLEEQVRSVEKSTDSWFIAYYISIVKFLPYVTLVKSTPFRLCLCQRISIQLQCSLKVYVTMSWAVDSYTAVNYMTWDLYKNS